MPQKRFYGWTLVAVLWVIYFINASFPIYGAGVINSYMAKSININRSVLGLGSTIFGLANSIPAALIALSVNKLGIRITLFAGSLITAAGAFVMAFLVESGTGYILAYGFIMGSGVGLGALLPIQSAVTFWFKRKKSMAMSIVFTAAGIGGFIASPAIDRIIKAANGDWHIPWIYIGIMSLIAAVVSILFVKNKPSDIGQLQDGDSESEITHNSNNNKSRLHYTEYQWTISDILKSRSFWLISFASVGFFASYYMCIAHGVINLMDKKIPTELAAMSMGLLTLFSIAGKLAAGYFGDRYEPRYIYSIGLILLAIGCIFANYATSVIGVYLYAICIGVGFGSSYVCMLSIYGNYYGSKVFATIMGMVYPVVDTIGYTSPVIAGIIYDKSGSYFTAFAGAGILAAAGSIAIIFSIPAKSLSRIDEQS